MTPDEAASVRHFLTLVWNTAQASTLNDLDALMRDGSLSWPQAREAFDKLMAERGAANQAAIDRLTATLGKGKGGAQ